MTTAKESLTDPSLSPLPCSAADSQHRNPSKDSTNNLDHRCEFTFSDGRQCRNQRASLCVHHASKLRRNSGDASRRNVYQQDELSPVNSSRESHGDQELSRVNKVNVNEGTLPSLEPLCSDLTTATNINRALAQVFLLTAQGRISQKQAVAFGYLSQLLLQTVPGIRGEFVSAFGYHPWEQKLKQSLESNDNEDPNDSTPGGETPQQPIDKPTVDRRPFEERVMAPDYDSIVSRGRDLLAGKYSVTPEGRREAKTLNTELELMQPPVAKMPKGARASVIEHMKRWIAQKKAPIRPGSASHPPAKVCPSAAESLLAANVYRPSGESHGHQELSPVHKVELSPVNSSRESRSPRTSFREKATNRMRFSRSTKTSGASRRSQSHQELSRVNKVPSPRKPEISNPKLPASPTPSSEHSEAAPQTNPREEHLAAPLSRRQPQPQPPPTRVDWYAPVSWSNTRKPDPFPSRREKAARPLRGMNGCRLRHLQHAQQSRFLE